MKKRVLSFVLAVAMLSGFLLGTGGLRLSAFAANDITIKLHYHRPDGKYDNWSTWFWTDQGTAHPFEEENGEMVATYHLNPGATQVGYIVRLGEWEAKDVEEDQFIDLAGVLGGTVHVYVESGVKGHRIEYGSDVVKGTVIVGSRYDGKLKIAVKLSGPPEKEPTTQTFTVRGADGECAIESIKAVSNYYYLTLREPLAADKGYKIIFENREYTIEMPDFYASADFEKENTYTGSDLGATYTKDQTALRVWAPTAKAVTVNLYTDGDPAKQEKPVEQVAMTKDVNGTWVATLEGDKNGTYYTYLVDLDGTVNEACDPYARTTGVNGHRAMILDLAATNPSGWDSDKDPNAGKNFTDAIIYELHIRDLSSDASSGIKNTGKFLGLIETGTTNANGNPTGLDHIKDLGITHLHILPAYDFGSVDETKLEQPQFNWGYDPVNYNVPEGSYSTDPYNGAVRVSEMKQMVKGLHDNGISVIMDVVYNHVQDSGRFCFNQIVPGYFSRPGSNGSGCGNDTASERAMVSKYIVDSVKYWADEYHVDGFRFDLVGLIDTETINTVMTEVHKTHPNVVFYGEGWSMNTTPTKPGYTMTTQQNASKVPGFAFFNDTIRDMLKGSVFDQSTGFVSGASGKEFDLKQCFLGQPNWCRTPLQTINYASCHDNNTLFDRIVLSTPNASRDDQIRMNNLAAAIYLTSQGVPFIHAGEEILRSKPLGDGTFEHNSYSRPDAVNSIKWDTLSDAQYQDVYHYYKGLIAFRKAHSALRMTDADMVSEGITPVNGTPANVVAFNIQGGINGDTAADGMFVVFNANKNEAEIKLPEGNWNIYINGEKAGTEVLGSVSGTATVDPISALVLVKEAAPAGAESASAEKSSPNWGLWLGIGAAVVAAAAVTAVVIYKKKSK